ncbi:MAG: rod shape-determining protein MreD [Candidatus Delongbacteria bacterium]|nr:rod shape-determining protein MreD [Candidatus Delongbacteria bacterium]MBN2836097.1 rod shape-determining protein MreD [Candidatus Delongbacteria bacterium]
MKNFKFGLILISLILFQTLLGDLISISEIIPDIVLISLILHAYSEENIYVATITGFFTGLFTDLFSGNPVGLSSLSYSIICFYAVKAGSKVENSTKTIIFIISLFSILFHYFIKSFLFLSQNTYFSVLLTSIIPSLVYTSIVQVIITYFIPYEKKRKRI